MADEINAEQPVKPVKKGMSAVGVLISLVLGIALGAVGSWYLGIEQYSAKVQNQNNEAFGVLLGSSVEKLAKAQATIGAHNYGDAEKMLDETLRSFQLAQTVIGAQAESKQIEEVISGIGEVQTAVKNLQANAGDKLGELLGKAQEIQKPETGPIGFLHRHKKPAVGEPSKTEAPAPPSPGGSPSPPPAPEKAPEPAPAPAPPTQPGPSAPATR